MNAISLHDSLRDNIAKMVHPYMRDGDPHMWSEAQAFANIVLRMVAAAEKSEVQPTSAWSYAHQGPSYDPRVSFDRNWAGPPELKPKVYRSQAEKDTWYSCVVDNEYRLGKLGPDDVVVDIGAHIGGFSFAAYRHGSRSIYAFEIDPWHVEAATVNLSDLKDGVLLHHMAVVRGDEHRAAQYYYDGNWNAFGVVGQQVMSDSLDGILERIGEPVRLLKIDCEGGEWPILSTCKRLDQIQEIVGEYHLVDAIAPELQHLDIEMSAEGLARFLRAKGFEVEIVPHEGLTGGFFAKRVSSSAVVPAGPFVPVLREGSADASFWRGSHDLNCFGLPERLEPDDRVLDLGAGVGSFTRLAWERGSRNIVAVEADPDTYDVLEKNVGDCAGVVLERAVVTGFPRPGIAWREGAASLYEVNLSSIGRYIETTQSGLDTLAGPGRVRFLKINIEGSEWGVLYRAQCLDRIEEIAGQLHEPGEPDLPLLMQENDLPPFMAIEMKGFLEKKGFAVTLTPPDEGHRIWGFHAKRAPVAPRGLRLLT